MENKVFLVKEMSHGTLMFPPERKKKYKRRPGDNLRTWQVKNCALRDTNIELMVNKCQNFIDNSIVHPEIMADLERDIAEHGDLWKELAKQ